jgi:hypothetical protein
MQMPPIDYEAMARRINQGVLSLDEISPGDVVSLPSWYRLKSRQRRINVILLICNEHGREYIYMAARLRNGRPSQDRRTFVYWPLSRVSSLRKYGAGSHE